MVLIFSIIGSKATKRAENEHKSQRTSNAHAQVKVMLNMVSVPLTTEKMKKAASRQSRRFIKKARELGCDEDERAFEEKLKQLAKAKAALKALENPYVRDLIEVLMPHPRGLSRRLVLHTLERKRKQTGLPIPEKFEQSVQSAFQRHCVDSLVFKKRKAPEWQGLFSFPQGKGSGIWAVYPDRANAWLERFPDHT